MTWATTPGSWPCRNPPAYEVSWFARPGYVARALEYYSGRTGIPWVAIPASRKDLWLVDSTTRHWGKLLDLLEPRIDARETVHPVPHVVVDGRWREYVPRLETAVLRRLHTLRFNAERISHRAYVNAFHRRGGTDVGVGDDVATVSVVPLNVETTSIPRVHRVDFMDGNTVVHRVWFEQLAAELPHLVRPYSGSFPPRFVIRRPGPEDRACLAAIQL